MSKPDDEKPPIIIVKRVKKGSDAHHGGAWKVAYADFVTAMMAFFLLLWLLNVTTDEQKSQIAAYFSPADPRIAETLSGSGGVMGGLTLSPEGAMPEDREIIANPNDPASGIGREGDSAELEQARLAELDRADTTSFRKAEEDLRQAIESVPELKELAQNLIIDQTPEGLRIQIVDQQGKSMFPLGGIEPLPPARALMSTIAKVVADMPNKISVRGHTDSLPYGSNAKYTNWELSADRANASRRVLIEADLDIARIENIQGKADREHLVPDDPNSPRNRRISIILLRQSLVKGLSGPATRVGQQPQRPQPRKREEGVIYFP